MLRSAKHVSQVLFAEDEVARNGNPNTVIIDMSSVSPEDANEISVKPIEYDMYSLDAPVSGGQSMAIEGKLTIMAGGAKNALIKFCPFLKRWVKTSM